MKINDLKITKKLTYAFATVVTCFVIVCGIVWLNVDSLKKSSSWDAHTSQVIYNIDAAKAAMVDRETGVRGFLLSGDRKFLEPFNNGNVEFEKAVGALSSLTADNPVQQERIKRLKASARGWVDNIASKEIALRSEPATAQEAIAMETSGSGKVRMDAIRVILGEMRQMESDLADKRAAKTAATVLSTKIALLLGAFFSILIVVILTRLINATITSPLVAVTKAMSDVTEGKRKVAIPARDRADEIGQLAAAAFAFSQATEALLNEKEISARFEQDRVQGEADKARAAERQAAVVRELSDGLDQLAQNNLTFRIEREFSPEFELLRTNFNAAIEYLQTAISQVAISAETLGSGSHQISEASNDLSKRTEQQAASLEETAAALDQITAIVHRSADRARQVTAAATAAKTDVSNVGAVMADTVTAMREIERGSREITNIISVIDEIAFQTNLLALNAGVEAARAGDSGRGFAVVASEVRGLAQRSAEAAREIKGLISSSSSQVDRGVKLVEETGQALSGIEARVVEIDTLIEEIARSAQEQATALTQVNTAVNHMDRVTQQNAAMVEESNATTAGLSTEAKDLMGMVQLFKLGRPTSIASFDSVSVSRDRAPSQMRPQGAPRAPAAPRTLASNSPRPALKTSGFGGAARAIRVDDTADEGWAEF